MFVADGKRTMLVLPRGARFPEGVVAGKRVLTRFNANDHVRIACFDNMATAFNADDALDTVCLVNPTYTQLLRIAVYLRRRAWAGNLLLLLDTKCLPRAF